MSNTPKIQPVIMSGGSGTRLWPLSRHTKPKQLLPLVTDNTMLQETAMRMHGPEFSDPVIICGTAHAELISRQLQEIDINPAAIITEPMARNTAAVAAVAASWTNTHNPDAMVLLSPADHHIEDVDGFQTAAFNARGAARDDNIVTLGIQPVNPHTGFGYIKKGKALFGSKVFRVDAFLEKPTRKNAKKYLKDGDFFWNAGIFLFAPSTMTKALQTYVPEILDKASAALANGKVDQGITHLDEALFAQCPSDSIDYAVMEKTDKAAIVAPVDVGWSDIGSWTALETDQQNDNIIAIDCKNTLVKSDKSLVATIGLEDMIVVATDDAILVAKRDRAEDVKAVIENLKKLNRSDLL